MFDPVCPDADRARKRQPTSDAAPKQPAAEPGWLELVRQQVASLRYGVVQIVVHDAQVTQIEKTERVRLEQARSENR